MLASCRVSLPTIKLFLVESALVFEHIPTVLRGKVTNGQIDKVIVTFHPFPRNSGTYLYQVWDNGLLCRRNLLQQIFTKQRSIEEQGSVFSSVCLFVCLFVNTITSERLNVG